MAKCFAVKTFNLFFEKENKNNKNREINNLIEIEFKIPVSDHHIRNLIRYLVFLFLISFGSIFFFLLFSGFLIG